uniref:ERCC4 domain-containing protein n=1 Tax=viral metagenome TaxID=1070528 RepID=A0A6C0EJ66_9ZZZZ
MKIVVDCREESLLKLLNEGLENNATSITCVQEQLLLGDIIFRDDNDKEIVLFERKSHNDLNASLKDGRYNEQSLRLNSHELCNHNIIYLLEESPSHKQFNKARTMTSNLFHSCIFSLLMYKGFSVLQTKSVMHTSEMLIDFAKKMEKEKDKSFYSFTDLQNNEINSTEYTKTIRKEKKANITPDNIDVIMLSQIPDVSVTSANAILDKYKTIYELTKSLNENPNSLKEISYQTKTDKTRKLTSRVIENVRKYLCHQEKEHTINMSEII